ETVDGSPMIGYVFGFVGLTAGGKLKHCSHIACVTQAYRDKNVGFELKAAQRSKVLEQGIDLITWTYDPLQSLNARFNLRKLGATCNTYLPNLYFNMNDSINRGLPSDRFQVDWHIKSARVEARLNRTGSDQGPQTLKDANAKLLNKPL